jgi:hypothetical protein
LSVHAATGLGVLVESKGYIVKRRHTKLRFKSAKYNFNFKRNILLCTGVECDLEITEAVMEVVVEKGINQQRRIKSKDKYANMRSL